MPRLITLDVSELEPPEPMQVILERLSQLEADAALRILHRRQPFPLYTLLQESGYAHHCIRLGPDQFVIYIWPQSDASLAEFCHQSADQEPLS